MYQIIPPSIDFTMGTASLSVAHYGHPLLKGAKHWSFLLDTSEGCAITYQLTGSTNTYELKEPEEIEILKSQTRHLLGKSCSRNY